MTAVRELPVALSLPAQLKRSAITTWHELPTVIGACAIWLATLAPVVAAVLVGTWWLIALSTIPLALATTGIARFAARMHRGDRARLRDIIAVDPVLAIALVVCGTAAERLATGGPGVQFVGFALAAVILVVAPLALAYGAVRGRTGFAAIRGGAILAAYRPSAALTVLSLGCIGAFAIAASAGALGVVVPCMLAVFASSVVAGLLDQIDAKGATS